mmetsp:Transcript_8161/g.27105  ORF Transcript_8161/g.27105 Transcript_8161/m.27105 type:complete len:341 (-) Transcript_8161:19-1041(-)
MSTDPERERLPHSCDAGLVEKLILDGFCVARNHFPIVRLKRVHRDRRRGRNVRLGQHPDARGSWKGDELRERRRHLQLWAGGGGARPCHIPNRRRTRWHLRRRVTGARQLRLRRRRHREGSRFAIQSAQLQHERQIWSSLEERRDHRRRHRHKARRFMHYTHTQIHPSARARLQVRLNHIHRHFLLPPIPVLLQPHPPLRVSPLPLSFPPEILSSSPSPSPSLAAPQPPYKFFAGPAPLPLPSSLLAFLLPPEEPLDGAAAGRTTFKVLPNDEARRAASASLRALMSVVTSCVALSSFFGALYSLPFLVLDTRDATRLGASCFVAPAFFPAFFSGFCMRD